jgi:2,3-bisphosphoglycerate-dependent phosphoglycerate mutase
LEDVSVFANDPRYQNLKNWEIPKGESLKDVESRLMPFWYSSILPKLQKNGTILVGAHGNSLRALVKNLENIGDKEVEDLEIPTGEPRLYELTATKTGYQLSPPVILR